MTEKKCIDCKKCGPFDVFKGYCEYKKERVLLDTPADDCSMYEQAGKCKHCEKYSVTPGKDFIGLCAGKMVFPDLKACQEYKAQA